MRRADLLRGGLARRGIIGQNEGFSYNTSGRAWLGAFAHGETF